MTGELEDSFWNAFLAQIGEGEIVPVAGLSAVTGNNRDRNCLCQSRPFL